MNQTMNQALNQIVNAGMNVDTNIVTNAFKQIFNNRQAFVGYITAGHRGIAYTEQAACALVEGGVDILEIGIPFSDPIADGPIIQAAMKEALKGSVEVRGEASVEVLGEVPITIDSVLKAIRNIKKQTNVPIVLFSYFNPLLSMGLDKALYEAADAGVDGILVVDLPIEESREEPREESREESNNYFEKCLSNNLAPICLLSPSTDKNRIKEISKHANAFLYYVCRNGTTGIKDALPNDYVEKIKTIKSLSSQPVVSGFGIGNKTLAAQALKHADGFVVGSAFVSAISNGASPSDLKNLAIEIDPR